MVQKNIILVDDTTTATGKYKVSKEMEKYNSAHIIELDKWENTRFPTWPD